MHIGDTFAVSNGSHGLASATQEGRDKTKNAFHEIR